MEEKQTASNRIRDRNVVDTLREDQTDLASGSKKNWKAFRDRLRLKLTGKAWISSVPIPQSDIPIQSRTNRVMTRGFWRYPREDDDADESNREWTERQQIIRLLPLETDPDDETTTVHQRTSRNRWPEKEIKRMSLLTLLSTDGSNYIEDEDEHVEEHHDGELEEDDDTGDHCVCCGCRAKRKGMALCACGHTFYEQCTKEVDVVRGNSPTCNNFILEIIDMF